MSRPRVRPAHDAEKMRGALERAQESVLCSPGEHRCTALALWALGQTAMARQAARECEEKNNGRTGGTSMTITEIDDAYVATGWTELSADYVGMGDDDISEGWRVHDLPEGVNYADFIAGELTKEQADWLAKSFNGWPAVMAELAAKDAEIARLREALEAIVENSDDVGAVECASEALGDGQ